MKSNTELLVEKAVKWHLDKDIPFTENLYTPQNEISNMILAEAKVLYRTGKYTPKTEFEEELLNTDIGEYGIYQNKAVPLDFPTIDTNNKVCVYIKDKMRGIKKLNFTYSYSTQKELDKTKSEYWGHRLDTFDKLLSHYVK